jgi:high-affinity nickel-transport protein
MRHSRNVAVDLAPAGERLRALRESLTPAEWTRVAGMFAAVAGLFVLGTVLVALAAPHHYVLSGRGTGEQVFGFGTGVLALTLGMRHAFDADHISAIDNTTRSLMARGKRPTSVGFFFSLGHSSVVFALSVVLNFGIKTVFRQVQDGDSGLHRVTSIVGTGVSGGFLYLIAALNLAILVSIVRIFREMRRGRFDEAELEAQLDQRGLMNRFLAPLARRVDRPWKMYPIGLLFGLGFDTATEVALLVVSAGAVTHGLPWWAILALPILFAAGMSFFDTLDGCFMNFAYGWAFFRPIRKVYYNITITALSVAVALIIGTLEILSMVQAEWGLSGGFFGAVAGFNLNTAGYVVVALFGLTWLVALSVWRWGRIEERWDMAAATARDCATAAAID